MAFNVFPNPTSSLLFVKGTQVLPADARYEIVDVLGLVLLNGNLKGIQTSIDVRHLYSGSYFLQLSTGSAHSTVLFVKATN